MSGVHFFIMKRLTELQRYVVYSDQEERTLLQDCVLYVFKELNTVIKMINYNREEIEKYQDNAKLTSLSAYNMVFEMIHDFSNPIDEFIPFLFTHRISNEGEEPRFDNYFVVLNLREFFVENYRYKFKPRESLNTFLTVQKLNQYKGIDEMPGFDKSYREFNMNTRINGCPMFTRCSNFERGLYVPSYQN